MKPAHARRIPCIVLLLCGFCALSSRSAAQSQGVPSGNNDGATYIVFDPPNASSTTVTGINDAGDIVGYFQDSQTNATRGFVRGRAGNIIVFDAAPNASETTPAAINAAGDVAGFFFDPVIGIRSFLRDAQGVTTTFDVPQPNPSSHEVGFAMAIDNSGVIAGFIIPCPGCDTWVGFVRDRQGNITSFESIPHGSVPTSINERGDVAGITSPFFPSQEGFLRDRSGLMTVFDAGGNGPGPKAHPLGINNRGDVAGYYYDSQSRTIRGFQRDRSGNITTFDASANASATIPSALNDSGKIVGDFTDATGTPHNFLLDSHGTITVFDVPNAFTAHADSINNRGDVAGYGYFLATNRNRGFVRVAGPNN